MSYASVTASNIDPKKEQPRPDPALLNTTEPTSNTTIDEAVKVNLVAPKRENESPRTSSSKSQPSQSGTSSHSGYPSKPPTRSPSDGKRWVRETQAEASYIWDSAKKYLLRPGLAGGVLGFVNIGFIGGIGRLMYMRPGLRRDPGFIVSTIIATFGLFSIEAYAAERHAKLASGTEEGRRAREGKNEIYHTAKELVFRPGVFNGLLGFVNTAILGTLGYLSYIHWDRPHWDRRIVSSITVGLIALVSGEGWIAERYQSSRAR